MNRDIFYLERLFIEYINEEGFVSIGTSQFERNHILYELDNEAYKEFFESWKNERKLQNIEKAKNNLTLFSTKERFDKLKEIYKRGKLTPFIGAGLSAPSGFLLWKDFLIDTQKETSSCTETFKAHLDHFEYEEAAQMLEDHSSTHLLERLDNCFGVKKSMNEVNGVIYKLPNIFFDQSVVTTNYDDLIKTVYENQEKPFDHILQGVTAKEFSLLNSQGKRMLLKLHGEYYSPSTRILTSSDYEQHYNQNNTIKRCVEEIASQSLLFLGCSLGEDRYISCLKELVREKGQNNTARHYAFLHIPEDGNDRIKKKEKLESANIFPIWYEGDHDESIEALLELLIE